MINDDKNYDMITDKNYEMKEYLCIILKIPYKYNINKLDCKQHLLFHSISLLEEKFNYKLHIIAETSDIIEKIKNIAILYIDDNYIDNEKTLYIHHNTSSYRFRRFLFGLVRGHRHKSI